MVSALRRLLIVWSRALALHRRFGVGQVFRCGDLRRAVLLLVVAVWWFAVAPPGAAAPSAQASNPTATFVAEAEEALQAGQPAEAIAIYRRALADAPEWAEGWWRLGLVLYDGDEYAAAAEAFERSTSLEPGLGTTWVMLGLSEFQVGRFDEALAHLQHGRRLGMTADPQLRHVALYHEGLLLLGRSEFERAQETLAQLSHGGVESDELTMALGLAALRLRPTDVPEGDSPEQRLARRVGTVEHLAARKQFERAEAEYEDLARAYADAQNVHYARGRYYVSTHQPDKGLAAFTRELENSPDHVPALLSIAAIRMETDPAAALPYAERAVRLNPRIPLGHYLLGSLLLHAGQVDRAITELELAEQAVTEDPGLYYALGRAYARAGRTADADRARARFKELSEARDRAARGDAAPR